MLAPHQQKIYNAARADQLLSLERRDALTASELIDLAVAMANSRGMEKIQTMERDPATREIVSTVTVDVPTYERLLHRLSGRLQALIDFYGAVNRAGLRVSFKKADTPR